MAWLRRLILRLVNALRPGRADAEVAREVAAHLECLEEEFQRRGLTGDAVRLAARRALGDPSHVKALHRDARSFGWMDNLRLDLRDTRRSLWRNRRATTIAVGIIAAAGAVNAAILGIADGVLLRPLPYQDADRVFVVLMQNPDSGERGTLVPWEVLHALERPTGALSAAAAFQGGRSIPAGGEEPDVTTASVTGSYFEVLGVRPVLGRLLSPDDEASGGRAAMLSHAAWLRRFGGDTRVVGRAVTFGDRTFDVVGVLPPGLFVPTLGPVSRIGEGLPEVVIATPKAAPNGRGGTFYPIVRLTGDVTIEHADAQLRALIESGVMDVESTVPVLQPVRSVLFPTGLPIMRLLLGSALALLVLACVNLASLLLVRGHGRAREVAVRLALGASRARIVRPVLLEVLFVVIAGGGLAVIGASLAFDAILEQVPRAAYGNAPVGIDTRVAFLTMGLALVTGGLFALLPAWRAWTGNNHVRIGTAPTRGSAPPWTFGRPLLTLQVALAVVLVFGAILAARAFVSILGTPLGFNPENVIAISVRPAAGADLAALHERALDVLGGRPETVAVGAMGQRPFDGSAPDEGVRRANPSDPLIGVTYVLPGFDAAIELPLLRGRSLVRADVRANPDAALVSQSAARLMFGDADPVGATFDNGRGRTFHVVGVVADLRHSIDGLDRDTAPSTYAFPAPGRSRPLTFLVKVRERREAVLRDLQEQLSTLAPSPTTAVWWSDAISNVTAYRNPRFQTIVLGALGGLALGLTAFGVFGVVAFLAAARTRELGIRAAIGATPRALVSLSFRQAFVPVLAGTVLGLLATRWAARFAEAQLFRMDTRDPLTLAATALAIVLATAAAAYLPARRAAKVDPVTVLRAE